MIEVLGHARLSFGSVSSFHGFQDGFVIGVRAGRVFDLDTDAVQANLEEGVDERHEHCLVQGIVRGLGEELMEGDVAPGVCAMHFG